MTKELADKVAIVTGGASGIGRATVELFVAEGARVVIADIQEERAKQLVKELGDVSAFKLTNVADANDMESLISFTVETYGGLDIMFNNAGVSGAEGSSVFVENDFSNFNKVMSVDLLGPLLGSKYAGKYMMENSGGVIINTASIAGSYSGYGVTEYRTAKAGVISLTKSLALELGEHNIRVNSISPGPIQTEMVALEGILPEDKLEKAQDLAMGVMLDMQPLKRFGQPVDIAQAALFLASERAAQITGIDLVVDGGASLGDKVNRQALMETEIGKLMGA